MDLKTAGYQNLAEYRSLIQDRDEKYNWARVQSYDVKFRSNLAAKPLADRFDFHKIDTRLFVTILDATVVKSQQNLSPL